LNVPLLVVVALATAAVVSAGLAFTVRGFKASAARADPNRNGHDPAAAGHAISRHDPATTEQLKRFFDGKACAICRRTIPPVQRTGPKPGVLNPTTHEAHAWEQIPTENLSAALEGELPLCPSCMIAEAFRQRFPDRVVDRKRSLQDAHSRPLA
jgi:hypothetical protein